MSYIFPPHPIVGQQVTGPNGTAWVWDGTKWVDAANGPFLALSGGTLTGPLYLHSDPTLPLEAATKDYVDTFVGEFPGPAPFDGQAYGQELGDWTPVLPITGGVMEGSIDSAGWDIFGLTNPPLRPDSAVSRQYVDSNIGAIQVFAGTWRVSPNVPDLSKTTGLINGQFYTAVTADPNTPETAPAGIPGLSGLSIFNNSQIVWNAALRLWQVVVASNLNKNQADLLYVSKSGSTMSGALVLSGDPNLPLGAVTKQYADGLLNRFAVPIQSDPPTPHVGGLWWDADDNQLYIWYDDGTSRQWVVANSSGISADAPSTANVYGRSSGAWTPVVPLSQVGVSNGLATLDSTGHVPTTQLPGAVTGTLTYLGGWNASTNTPVLATGGLSGGTVQAAGRYYVVTVGATITAIDGITVVVAGDWMVSSGTAWQRVQNSTSPYLPLAGGAMTAGAAISGLGSVAFSDTSTIRYTAAMPDLAWYRRDAAGNIAQGLDWGGVSLFQAVTIYGGMNVQGPVNISSLSLPSATITALNATSVTTPDGSVYSQSSGPSVDFVYRWRDLAGNVAAGIATDGTFVVQNMNVLGTLTTTSGSGSGGGGGDDPNSYTPLRIQAMDAKAVANSMAVKGQTNSGIASPIWTHNMILIYGQSLSIGNQGLPRMSTNEGLDNLTLGASPGGVQTDTDFVFIPDLNSNINNLDGTRGYETPGISAVNQWRALQLGWRDLATDPSRRIIVNGCGSGGKAIEELSKGYGPTPFYNRIPSLLNQLRTAITAASASNTFGVCGVYYLQGEANYATNTGFDSSTSGYLAKWNQLRSDISADVMAITGQKLPPAFFASQPNSEWDGSLRQTTIGNAYIQACTTPPLGDFLCMPNYAAPNSNPNGPHMSPDGYRYMGNGVGKIMHRVFDRGETWLPLYVTRATFRGKQILLECHTPEPPLQVQPFYGGSDGSTIQPILGDYGFSAGDDLGTLPITSIVLYNSVILINFSRAVSTNPWIDYANYGHSGCGNICDSDPFISLDKFGTLPAAAIGTPYPSWNWMVAFRMNVSADS